MGHSIAPGTLVSAADEGKAIWAYFDWQSTVPPA